MDNDSRKRHGGHLGSHFRTKLVLPSLSTIDQGSCYSVGQNGVSSAPLTLLSSLVSVRKGQRRERAQFLQREPSYQTSTDPFSEQGCQSLEGELREKDVLVRAEGPWSHLDLDPS